VGRPVRIRARERGSRQPPGAAIALTQGRRRRALALAAALLLAGCASDGEEQAGPEPATSSVPTVATVEPGPEPATTEEPDTQPPPAPTPAPTTRTEPGVATATGPARREAPPARAGALVFDRIVVVPGEDGAFLGRANVRNAGAAYLNGPAVRWRILGRDGSELDGGVVRWPSLAPGETRTVELEGSRRYSDDWARVTFSPR
jgi:hypothetical protein